MAKSKRKILEDAVCDLLATRLAAEGYDFHRDPEMSLFTKQAGGATCKLAFHLWGSSPYHFQDSVWIVHDDYAAILRDLIADTPMRGADIAFGGPSDHVANHWAEPDPRTVSSVHGVAPFADAFLRALHRATETFLLPNADPAKVADDCTLFYTKWPRGMGPIKTAFHLIAHGLARGDRPTIQLGADRITHRIDFCRMPHERDVALAIRDAAMARLASLPS